MNQLRFYLVARHPSSLFQNSVFRLRHSRLLTISICIFLNVCNENMLLNNNICLERSLRCWTSWRWFQWWVRCSESDNVKRRDRRGYIDTISNPAYFFANHESKFVLKMKWVINQIRIKSLCQLLFLIVIQFFRRESSSQIISECALSFILFYFILSLQKKRWKMQYPILAAFSWQFAQLFIFSGWN